MIEVSSSWNFIRLMYVLLMDRFLYATYLMIFPLSFLADSLFFCYHHIVSLLNAAIAS